MTIRARDLGIAPAGRPGPNDAITDVPGVEVGFTTLVEGTSVRTGVTAVLPRGKADFGTPCAAGRYSLNGNGEMTGTAMIDESGALPLPVLITNTHAVGPCHRGAIDWVVRERPDSPPRWLLPVVAETWDGYLNDTDASVVRPEDAVAALDAAASGPVAEGSVGGGTGMTCYGYKGGTGTASRVVSYAGQEFTVGVLLQANFGDRGELTVAGERVGVADLAEDDPMSDTSWLAPAGAGSVIVIVATDAPLLPNQCQALARRVPFGLARTGTTGSHFSGDLFLAFSTANPGALTSHFPRADDAEFETLSFVPWGRIDPFYEATVQAVEEAVLNALVAAEDMTGNDGHRVPAMPHERWKTRVDA
ncbi:DmpA family aminopeptidase [Pseudonocardia phyllosphaerae]|uniref:DmpA family aminopeptidase n=1 Tax=Pseudonocardia phyllosphaerae TaxID=3390502 RepID=UPI0039791658